MVRHSHPAAPLYGIVRVFEDGKFGFITTIDGRDLFFGAHRIIGRAPAVGDRVAYELATHHGRPVAVDVRVVREPSSR
jgi:cold shock CspA family protein